MVQQIQKNGLFQQGYKKEGCEPHLCKDTLCGEAVLEDAWAMQEKEFKLFQLWQGDPVGADC